MEYIGLIRVLTIVGFAVTLFVLLVDGLMTPWYKSAPGRAVFGLLFMLTLEMGLSVAATLFGHYPHRIIVAIVAYVLLLITTCLVGSAIIHEQIRGRRITRKRNHDAR